MADSLRLRAHSRGHGVVVVELIGEIDIASARGLDAILNVTRAPAPPSGLLVLLDLSRLEFCDAAGLGQLGATARRLAGCGARVGLVSPRQRFMHLLEAAKLGGYFEVYPSLPAAGAAPAGGDLQPVAA